MKVLNRSLNLKGRLLIYLLVSTIFLISVACNLLQPQVVQQTVVVVETPTPSASTTAVMTATQMTVVTSTSGAATDTPLSAVTVTPTSQPVPSPTLLALKIVPVEGDQNKIMGEIIYPDISPFTSWINFQVKARNPQVGKNDGAGINDVEFCINPTTDECDSSQNIYYHDEKNASYCAFGGVNPNCAIFDFSKKPHVWPGTNTQVISGTYDLTVTVHSKEGDVWPTTVTFDIKYP